MNCVWGWYKTNRACPSIVITWAFITFTHQRVKRGPASAVMVRCLVIALWWVQRFCTSAPWKCFSQQGFALWKRGGGEYLQAGYIPEANCETRRHIFVVELRECWTIGNCLHVFVHGFHWELYKSWTEKHLQKNTRLVLCSVQLHYACSCFFNIGL